jgi:hypothetical protein
MAKAMKTSKKYALWEQMLMPDDVFCDCGRKGEPDTCPYQEEVNGESEVCNCCAECRSNCHDDI